MSGTRFHVPRARGARKAGFFFMDQFLLPRRFQRGIACPLKGSGSGFSSGSRETDREMPDYDIRYIDVGLRRTLFDQWNGLCSIKETSHYNI